MGKVRILGNGRRTDNARRLKILAQEWYSLRPRVRPSVANNTMASECASNQSRADVRLPIKILQTADESLPHLGALMTRHVDSTSRPNRRCLRYFVTAAMGLSSGRWTGLRSCGIPGEE
jgi:hypothetical protein